MLGHRSLTPEDYLAILKRRWWIVLIPAMIAPVIAVGATFFMQPIYQSQSVVLIDQQKISANFVASVVTQDLNNRLASMEAQILSRSTLEPIVNKYNLYASEHLSMDARVDLTRKAVNVQVIQSGVTGASGMPGFKITFTANDPRTAQQVCSEVTTLFTGENLRIREADAEGTVNFLKEQLDQVKHTLDDEDKKVADFQSAHFGMLPGEEAQNENMLNSLNGQLEAETQSIQQMGQQRTMLDAMLAQQVSPAQSAAAAEKTPQAEESELATLQAQKDDLLTRYQPDYPEVKAIDRKIQDVQKEMAKAAAAPAPATPAAPPVTNRPDPIPVQQLRAQLRGLELAIQDKRKQQDATEAQIHAYQGRIQASPEVAEQYKELTRDYQTTQASYDQLLSKLNASQMATDLEHQQQGETFSLLDAANFPDAPTFPKRAMFAGGGVGAGLALGVLIVAFLEFRDTALRTERDVWAFTQLPTLAVIAWSGDLADESSAKRGKKGLFSRKGPKQLLTDSAG